MKALAVVMLATGVVCIAVILLALVLGVFLTGWNFPPLLVAAWSLLVICTLQAFYVGTRGE